MNLSEDWGMLSTAVAGIAGILYAVLDGDIFMGVLAILVIRLAYEIVELRSHIREVES
ncbi:hypothetical protein [Haloarcula argentinensis]|uniref:Uncharacterized protein n=1 Tax=Haloarcula argentinensis TaxID=43776 RepID=A0ABU2F653_HALAR|nr:hypothetical protein [Haloarcula argentinensis]MDS0256024.1 hypothetical protein [Haloarcula argentinensis]